MTTADDQGRKRLVMALACTRLEFPRDQEPVAVTFLKRWLGSWGGGIGRVAVGMARQGYDLQLTRYAEKGWRRDVLRLRPGALPDARDRLGLGADALAGGPGGGMAGARGARCPGGGDAGRQWPPLSCGRIVRSRRTPGDPEKDWKVDQVDDTDAEVFDAVVSG